MGRAREPLRLYYRERVWSALWIFGLVRSPVKVRFCCAVGKKDRTRSGVCRALAPLPHLFPGLDEFLNSSGAREMTWPNSTDKVCASIKILNGGHAHHREPTLQVRQFFPRQDFIRRPWTPSHDGHFMIFSFYSPCHFVRLRTRTCTLALRGVPSESEM